MATNRYYVDKSRMFQIAVSEDNGRTTAMIRGYQVRPAYTVPAARNLMVHRAYHRNGWTVSDRYTGLAVSHGPTPAVAVERAHARLVLKGDDAIHKARADAERDRRTVGMIYGPLAECYCAPCEASTPRAPDGSCAVCGTFQR